MPEFNAETEFDKARRVTVYPIAGVTGPWQDEPFDTSALPTQLIPDLHIEDVSSMFKNDTWDLFEGEMGKRDVEVLRRVKYAIVHRYWSTEHGTGDLERKSSELVYNIAACLRLIRPMKQYALVINGPIQPDGTIRVQSFDHPVHLVEISSIQKGFLLRNRDVMELKIVAVEFLKAMTGEYWKFRMPVSLYEAGHFQDRYWKARFFLWSSAIEAIFTSQTNNREHSGSKVAKERVKWF